MNPKSGAADPKSALNEPGTVETRALSLVPIPYRRKAVLNTLEGVRREMARVYRDAESAKRDTAEASKLVFMLGQIGKILELTEIEARLRALESRTRDRTIPAAR
jgi:hypothetical protein